MPFAAASSSSSSSSPAFGPQKVGFKGTNKNKSQTKLNTFCRKCLSNQRQVSWHLRCQQLPIRLQPGSCQGINLQLPKISAWNRIKCKSAAAAAAVATAWAARGRGAVGMGELASWPELVAHLVAFIGHLFLPPILFAARFIKQKI